MNESIKEIINAAQNEKESQKLTPGEPVVSISTRTSRASFIYERMRNAVDYKEEHLLRRAAIERILRRLIAFGKQKNLVESLIHELIHARYLPNNEIPKTKLEELNIIVNKYYRLLGLAPLKEVSSPNTLAGKTVGIMATEIDEFLVAPYVMHSSINAMYEHIEKYLHTEDDINQQELSRQIYIASSRALYKNDDDTLRYHLLLTYYPNWQTADENIINEVGENLGKLIDQIDIELNHPLKEKINPIARRNVAYFTILREIIVANPQTAPQTISQTDTLLEKVKQTCNAHYKESRSKLGRSIFRSAIYLILTKFLIALILEVPIEYFLLGELIFLPIIINFIFPPLLLGVIAVSTKLPGEKNTELIASGILKIINNNGEIIQLQKEKTRSIALQFIFALFYSLLFVISFGLLITILDLLSFTFISIVIFLFFLSLVSLFAYRIRRSSQELTVTPPKKGAVKSLWNFLSIPILHAGKWMSTKFAKINIFIFILDFVIEAPFKSFIKITEDWTNFVHDKKEEI